MYARGSAQEQDVELAAVRFVCELFSRNRHLSEGPVSREASPEVLEQLANHAIPDQGRPLEDVVREMQDSIIGYGYNIDHARFLGFVPGPVNAVSWLGDMMATAMPAALPTTPPDASPKTRSSGGCVTRPGSRRARAASS